MSLAPGYSREVIRANIKRLLKRLPRDTAIAEAHAQAASAWEARYPDRVLPSYIFQHHRRRANPAGDLDPRDVSKGLKLYEKFTGRPADRERVIARPILPDALVCIGKISLIQYVAERDGEVFEFHHPFRARSRPLLCVTPDGKLVLALGGAWTFTEDGFVDR
jgi:hypothetical protein